MSIRSPLDARLPDQVIAALAPYLDRYSTDPPVYTLSPDDCGGFLWVRHTSKRELGMGRLCAGYSLDGATFCDAPAVLTRGFLERAKAWCDEYAKSNPRNRNAYPKAFIDTGRTLAAELAAHLGSAGRVFMFFRPLASPDIHRQCYWFSSNGKHHTRHVSEVHRTSHLIECLNRLVPNPIDATGGDDLDSRALRLMFPPMHDDWMTVKWLLANSCSHLTGPLPKDWIRA